MSDKWALDTIENKYSLYRGKGCMKKLRSSLRQHATNVINFKRMRSLP